MHSQPFVLSSRSCETRSKRRAEIGAALATTLVVCLLSFSSGAAAKTDASPLSPAIGLCGELENHYGPFDYRTAPTDRKTLVERFHFTPRVETLQRGQSGEIGGDLDYTLRAFPNHPRALYAVSRYSLRHKTQQIPGSKIPIECYFDRAIRFAPDDAQVRALYADFLIQWKRPEEARRQLKIAEKLKTTPQVQYNLALAWTNLGDTDRALPLAKQAYAGGVEYSALRDRLKAAGAWRE